MLFAAVTVRADEAASVRFVKQLGGTTEDMKRVARGTASGSMGTS
jgi:hypothetical protein